MPTSSLNRVVGPTPPDAFERLLLHAEVVYNGLGMPRADGAVLLQRAGAAGATGASLTVADVRDRVGTARAFPEARLIDAGFAISPPVVNALTRLGQPDAVFHPLTGAHGASDAGAAGTPARAAQSGLEALRGLGISVIGDIVDDPQVMRLLLEERGMQGVAYWQVMDPEGASARQTFEATVAQVSEFRTLQRPGGVRVGLSPFSPYLVSAELMRLLTAWARSEGVPVAIRVAQSAAEAQLSLTGDGPAARALAGAGLPVSALGVSPVRYLHDLGALEGAPTLLHMAAVGPDDARLVARAGSVVVHVPRPDGSDAAFPWQLYQQHSVEVAFGTDTSGDGADLDVTTAVLTARDLHGASANPRALVRAAVKGGYKALGLRPPQVLRGAAADALVAWL